MKDLNCVVNFSSSVCVFQDRILGKRIGSAREFHGLYYFESASSMGGHVQLTVGNSSLSRSQQTMLLHCRLGYQSFVYLKYSFPSLFQKHDSFQCVVCQLAKHKRVFFPPQPYRASKPFMLIHKDIWGPSHTLSLTNKRWFVTFTYDHTRVCWVYLLKEKSEAGIVFQNFHSMTKT